MVTLWILGGLSVLSALTYGFHFVHHPPSMTRKICKVMAVGSLALISAIGGGPPLLTLALVLGAIGDGFLAWHGPRNFLSGLVAFLLGHLAYVGLLSGGSGGVGLILQDLWRMGLVSGLIVATALIVQRLLPHLGAMRGPVLIYAAVILAMGLTALTLPPHLPIALAGLGALLFITSDAILGFELFVVKDEDLRKGWPPTLLWILYWGGQTLIVLAFLLPYAGAT